MPGMTFDRKGIAFGVVYYSGTLLLAVASIIARLSVGVSLIVARKAILQGGPKTMESGLWLRDQTLIFIEKSHKSIKPRLLEVKKILKALIIIAVRNLKIKGGPKIITTGQIISQQCRLLIRTTTKRREKLDSAKKYQEISHREQMEENISSSMIPADQPIQ